MPTAHKRTLRIETLSAGALRLFRVENFLSPAEAAELRALRSLATDCTESGTGSTTVAGSMVQQNPAVEQMLGFFRDRASKRKLFNMYELNRDGELDGEELAMLFQGTRTRMYACIEECGCVFEVAITPPCMLHAHARMRARMRTCAHGHVYGYADVGTNL